MSETPQTRFDDEVLARLEVDAKDIIGRYPRPRSALLPLLHLVQSEEGYVSARGIEFCAEVLDITTAEVAAVATFYTQYKRRPNGEYNVGVCTNTLCAVMGGDQIFATLKDHLGVGNDETTDDGLVTLEHLECNAACDYAPVLMVNWEFFDNQTPESAVTLVDELRAGNRPTPPAAPRCAPSRRCPGCSPGSTTAGPAKGRRRGPPPWPACSSTARRCPPGSGATQTEASRRRGTAPADGASAARARDDRRQRPAPADRDERRSDDGAHTGPQPHVGPARVLDPRGLRAPRRLRRAAGRAAEDARRRHPARQGLRAARPRRRRVPDRHQVGLHPAGRRQAGLPGGQRRRVRAGHLQGHPAHAGQPARAGRGRGHRVLRDPGRRTPSSTCAARSCT